MTPSCRSASGGTGRVQVLNKSSGWSSQAPGAHLVDAIIRISPGRTGSCRDVLQL